MHYCLQLVTREVKPKFAPDTDGPRRLDEPPVRTQWLNTTNLYAVADAAIKHKFAQPACAAAGQERVKSACLTLAAEIAKHPPSRELVALEAAKMLLREWEALHLEHLKSDTLQRGTQR